MNNNSNYTADDLVYNPTSRLPVCLCIDVSSSMFRLIDLKGAVKTGETVYRDGQYWDLYDGGRSLFSNLIEGVNAFYDAIRKSEEASLSCEISVVVFSDDAKCIDDFSTIDRKGKFSISSDQCGDNTAMAQGVEKALEVLDNRKKQYKDYGIDYYQPWLVIFTDGNPTDNVSNVQKRCKELEANNKLTVLTLALSNDVNKETLKGFSKTDPISIQHDKIEDFFKWLGKSASVASTPGAGDTFKLDISDMDDWDEI